MLLSCCSGNVTVTCAHSPTRWRHTDNCVLPWEHTGRVTQFHFVFCTISNLDQNKVVVFLTKTSRSEHMQSRTATKQAARGSRVSSWGNYGSGSRVGWPPFERSVVQTPGPSRWHQAVNTVNPKLALKHPSEREWEGFVWCRMDGRAL